MINLFAHFDRHPTTIRRSPVVTQAAIKCDSVSTRTCSELLTLGPHHFPLLQILSREPKEGELRGTVVSACCLCTVDDRFEVTHTVILPAVKMSKLQNRVVLIGVGGATCSGKTTLAKHFRNILPNSIIIHQDPEELIPIHPVHNVADWDAPQGAIDWPRLRAFLKHVKDNGVIPPDHRSHDHMNEQKVVPITEAAEQELRTRFEEFENEQRKKGIRVMWGLVDGFLLYWDKVTYCDFLVHGFLADSA
ncbi:hypothetical protein JVT61DRAFT_10697 [Boletus reticuloceps]|uniref:P-loop containing nucleoside triphosphate hydrolase protein n=1 Tax=Boletus reticuloceps TaxID=495285 RepID=A0A8I2YFK9_9AGAM|nr:hypothetical protein JVT61DRAFT_10697 [Boletus reticuloceps]